LANLGDRQLERAVDSLKGVLVFDAFVAPALAPAAKPLK
jgi:carboxyl-terminal processing protease